MCFYSQISKTAQELKHRFNVRFDDEFDYITSNFNGFSFPKTPVIADVSNDNIELYNWGLIPHWAKDNTIRRNTLNAKIETINEKPSFRNSVNKRCLVISDVFFEWQWLDEKGKNKQKYFISLPNNEIFAFAGLWSEWTDKSTGEILKTYTILTIETNKLMAEIHNSKKRMPIILDKEIEFDWLKGNRIETNNIELKAIKV